MLVALTRSRSPRLAWAAGTVMTLAMVGLAAGMILLLCVFPDGRFMPRWVMWPAAAWVAQQVPIFFFPDSPFNTDHWPGLIILIANLVIFGTLIAAQLYRYQRVSSQLQRQQTKWLIFSFALAIMKHCSSA